MGCIDPINVEFLSGGGWNYIDVMSIFFLLRKSGSTRHRGDEHVMGCHDIAI
jgi:hypothetical protein